MPSLLNALQTLGPVNFRQLAREFHSVAKQTLFETQFFCVPVRFLSNFGRLCGTRTDANIDFEVFFFAKEKTVQKVKMFWGDSIV